MEKIAAMERGSERPRGGSYIFITERGTKSIVEKLVMKEVNNDITTLEKYGKMIEREGTKVKLTPPEEAMGKKRKCTATYRTLYLPTKKVGIEAKEEKCL